MAAYTNMAWPGDPYGTGQLWRKEPLLLSAFAACCVEDDERVVPVGYAAVYLRLHRSQPIDATNGLAFGFRAASAAGEPDRDELVRLYDLDVMRARRLAKILVGHRLTDDLCVMEAQTDGGEVGRGIRSLAADWQRPDRSHSGIASMFDVANNIPNGDDLAETATVNGLDTATVRRAFSSQRCVDLTVQAARGIAPSGLALWMGVEQAPAEDVLKKSALEWLAAYCTERALISALVAGRHLKRYTWDSALDVDAMLAANVWDCFPFQEFRSQDQAIV